MDVARDTRSAEAAASQIDTFIERRHSVRVRDEGERAELEAWQLSARVHAAKVRRENAAAWIDYHEEAAERAERNGLLIAHDHRARADALRAQMLLERGDAA